MRYLEVLSTDVTEKVSGELRNLREFELVAGFDTDYSILLNVALPKLEKLSLDTKWADITSLEPQDFAALSRSSPSLQHLELNYAEEKFISAAIQHFPALKTLVAQFFDEYDCFSSVPPHQNLILEELLVWIDYWSTPSKPAFETLSACPNLKRIQLHGVSFNGNEVLRLMRSHPHLTHFWFCANECDITNGDDGLNYLMTKLINVFRKSPHFVYFGIFGIDNHSKRVEGMLQDLLDDLLVDDADQNIVTMIETNRDEYCDLTLEKKIADPHTAVFQQRIDSNLYELTAPNGQSD